MREIAESDWRVLRQLHPLALDRFCQRTLAEVCEVAATTEGSAHERYLAVFDLIKRRDRDLAKAFDDLRRSTALQQLVLIQSHHLLTGDEFGRFSPATRDAVEAMLAAGSR